MAERNKWELIRSDTLTKKRIMVLLIVFSLLVVGMLGATGFRQIIQGDMLKERANNQWTRNIVLFAFRGEIQDRNGNPLAVSERTHMIVLQPGIIKNEAENLNEYNIDLYIDSLSNDLAEIIGLSPEEVRLSATKDRDQVILLRDITDEQINAINSLTYKYTKNDDEGNTEEKSKSYVGILINKDMKRVYPMGAFMTQLLGFVSVDAAVGIEGLEGRFDSDLSGKNGERIVQTDAQGAKITDSYEDRTEPVDGNDLQLTIDVTLQSFAESTLELCMREQNAKRVSCIVMDPSTGEILAMAVKPDYDNNTPPRSDGEMLASLTRNVPIRDSYEPTSIFDLITVAAAIDSAAATTNIYYSSQDYKIIEEQKIYCSSGLTARQQTLAQVVQASTDSAFIDMNLAMGVNTAFNYLYDFGFGYKTGVKLYSESPGNLQAEKYARDIDLASLGLGQGFEVTQMQLASAISAIANKGELMKPYIIQKVISPEGHVLQEYHSETTGKPISGYTADSVLWMMYDTVENGTGLNCKIEGYEIGGRAAVVQKYDDEGYALEDRYIATFAAVAPINDPKLVVLLVVDEPKGSSYYGSVSAAPYVRGFLEDALPYLNVYKNDAVIGTSQLKEVPDVLNMTVEEAESKLSQKGFGCISEGFDGKIITQIPEPGTMIKSGSNVIVQLKQVTDNDESYLVEVPDLFGLTPTEALELLDENNLTMRIVSSGNVVVEQNPSKGTKIYRGSQIAVSFDYFAKNDDDTEDED